jgi:hypothetical protein
MSSLAEISGQCTHSTLTEIGQAVNVQKCTDRPSADLDRLLRANAVTAGSREREVCRRAEIALVDFLGPVCSLALFNWEALK